MSGPNSPWPKASGPKPQAPVFPPKTVLVAVDFGEASARAVTLAGAIASAFGATLRAVHAERFEPPPYFTLEQIARLEAERRVAESAAVNHLIQFAAAATAHPVGANVLDEPPVDAILHAAADADLIVVGTHGRRGPGRWWLGSVAERVVRAATVPVLVTRTGTAAPTAMFERIVLVGEGHEPASGVRTVAEQLAGAFKGHVIQGGPITGCRPDVMAQATLVVMEMSGHHGAWALTDGVAKVLGGCQHPILFVPRTQLAN